MPLDMGLNGSTTTTPSGSLINNRRGTATAKGSGMATMTADGVKWEYEGDECPTMQEWWAFNFTGLGPSLPSKLVRQVMGRVLAMRLLAATIQKIEAETDSV